MIVRSASGPWETHIQAPSTLSSTPQAAVLAAVLSSSSAAFQESKGGNRNSGKFLELSHAGVQSAHSNMAHQQSRQPPALNMAAAAATQEQSPYSAPPITQSGYYGNISGLGSGQSSAASTNGSGSFGYGNGMMLPAPQQSQMYGSSAPYSVSSFTTQHNVGPHRIHAEVAGLSQHSVHEFHHGHGSTGMDGSLLHSFDGGAIMPMKPKRKQVKNACVNCQKACKRCDEARPCARCYKYGLTATCVDSARKERKRGIKRGPYKRRATTGSTPNNPSSLLQHSAMMLGGSYGPGGVANSSPHMRSMSSVSTTFRAESTGSAASSLYEGSSGGLENGHLINNAQYTSSAPGSVQRLPTSLPASGAMYDVPSVYGRDSAHTSMQPPANRPYGTNRSEYDRSNGVNHLPQYTSTSNGCNRYTSLSNGSVSGVPGAAPTNAANYGNGAGRSSTVTNPGGFSSACMSQQNPSFLSAPHNRVHSDGGIAVMNHASVNTSSASLSPRGHISNDVSGLSGFEGRPGYVHHSGSNLPGIGNNSASSFMNQQSNNGNGGGSGSTTPHQFPMHLPPAARTRNGSGNNHSNGSNHDDRSRPGSRQDDSLMFGDGNKDSMDGISNTSSVAASISSRYQLPTPRSDSNDTQHRAMMPKMESGTDIAAYGAAA